MLLSTILTPCAGGASTQYVGDAGDEDEDAKVESTQSSAGRPGRYRGRGARLCRRPAQARARACNPGLLSERCSFITLCTALAQVI